jgi:uncharacterized protein with HEPN domain
MPNVEIAEYFDLVRESIDLIEERFSKIDEPNDFVESAEGVVLLDAISMRLQVIGESVRKIQKTDSSFLNRYSDIEWDKIARFRDLVSHHYEQIDHEIVYDICNVHIPELKKTLEKIEFDISKVKTS